MKKGELDGAIRRALNVFDEWNDVTGTITKYSSNYYEIQAVIEDAVHCGAQAAAGVYEPLDRKIGTRHPIGQMIKPESGMTEDEEAIMDSLVAAWNTWRQLLPDDASGDEIRKFRDGIHLAQQVLSDRVLYRAFPKYWSKP
jgi:hypothetical protein